MKELGLKSYRFSVSWPRVISQDGKVNPKGLEFYSNLVDELIKRNRAARYALPLGSAALAI